VTKNTTYLLNILGVTNSLKISRSDKVTKVAQTHLGDIGQRTLSDLEEAITRGYIKCI
jgi:hypothetical protein